VEYERESGIRLILPAEAGREGDDVEESGFLHKKRVPPHFSFHFPFWRFPDLHSSTSDYFLDK
jgi:hypothetical protein